MSKIEKSYEYKNIYTPKYRESMKLRFRTNESCCFDDDYGYCPKYWYHGREKSKRVSNIILKIIESCVGKPFDVAYSKFVKKFPKLYYGNRNSREIFFEYFSHVINWKGEYVGDFYLDDDYIIRNREYNKKPKKLIPTKYKWDNVNYQVTDDIYNVFKLFFGESAYDILYLEHDSEFIEGVVNIFIREYYKHSKTKCSTWLKDNIYKCFIPCDFKEPDVMSFKQRKIYATEYRKKIKRDSRRYKKESRLKSEEYLRTYKRLQKEREMLENSILIEKNGFDELTSFRGLEYHGQKRKRKNSL